MARPKTSSASITLANARAAGLEAIDPNLDLSNGLTLIAYREKVGACQGEFDQYNTLVATLDGVGNSVEEAERQLNDWSVRMLAGVAAKYGKDSDEYEKAGGTRTSERRSPRRQSQPVTNPAPAQP